MTTYKITPPKRWTSGDTRDIFTQVALELLRDEMYGWALYEKQSTQGDTLLVRRDLLDEHKSNIEKMYDCTLTKVS